MPELPEVEVVRRGLAAWVAGRQVMDVDVHDARSLRRHEPSPGSDPGNPADAPTQPDPTPFARGEDFRARLRGRTLQEPQRRGKYLWLPLDSADSALLIHLGMSGQVLVEDRAAAAEKHLKISLDLSARPGAPEQLRFVDQRIFGGMQVTRLIAADHASGAVPAPVAHIAADPFETAADPSADERLFRALRRRRSGLKRALLDQSLISGIGNIYADEALWRAGLHFARRTETVTRDETSRLLTAARAVMSAALEAGGTSFDSLYVNVNGASGYFSRSLQAYGQAGGECSRCAVDGRSAGVIQRAKFMGRSSYWCPVCQPRPRNGRW
ncbi:bifunctional DNA-formamidopyrimidine glycosylase/DNA-(apurinic or apyrimidinic site) lyase [Nesterenkonia xinjiangensis]|uniref:Formamidopyrimidine-DNA glycosylase n=1 Tax=Nesterenkonia xinjiangensis TaxID=225327 RepID=A0A7Z0KA23_9MICC|nr:bifunctional DNA-formamidopyrimidine glycosylase/DNA-(apurinic or apyrimidinic site) lyase [Nesterenkonia xinjiangensis]NYJ79339.1 formamidopyrimidine-DNA glycosylase [Nesterenkonia xinjiangensis]